MALETGTFISDLVVTNPVASDPLAAADDHLRLIKSTIKNTFPNVSGAVTKTHAEINNLASQTDLAAVQSSVTTLSGTVSTLTTTVGTKADKATTITAGAGLSGGGDLSANRTLSIASSSNGFGTRTVSTGNPTGGSDGDIWYKV